MSTLDYNFNLDGTLELGTGTPYIVTDWAGYGIQGLRTSDDPRPMDHGSDVGPEYLNSRVLTLKVTARGESASGCAGSVDALLAAWFLDSTLDGYGARRQLSLKMPGYAERLLFGRPRRNTFDMTRINGRRADGELEFFAPDPRWYSATLHSVVMGLSQATSGRGYNRSYNYGYGGAVSNDTFLINNAGTFPTLPTIVITGPVSNPTIVNTTTGQTIKFLITLDTLDTLTVNFAERTVMLNSTASRYYTKVGDFFELKKGDNSLKYIANGYTASTATVSWRDAWL